MDERYIKPITKYSEKLEGWENILIEENGEKFYSTALYDGKQLYKASDGKTYELTGGDLSNLDDIRQTLFHEWTHVMEKCLVKASELSKKDIITKRGNSTYINASLSPDLNMEEYLSFIENVDKLLESDKEAVNYYLQMMIELGFSKQMGEKLPVDEFYY